MDATKLASTPGNPKSGLSDKIAARIAIADALRDIADEIENGFRIVSDLQTIEQVCAGANPASVLYMKTWIPNKPDQPAATPQGKTS